LAVVLAIHAPLSEVIQDLALPGRGAEVGDVVADLGGIALGWYLAGVVLRRRLGSDPSGMVAAQDTGHTGRTHGTLGTADHSGSSSAGGTGTSNTGSTGLSADERSPSGD